MNQDNIRGQSEAAYKQWCEQWRAHAIAHKSYKQKSLEQFENIGVGRALVCVANGYSFEEEIETLKELQHNVDILCCDKTLGKLLEHGITPAYCMVCDANVDFSKYMQKWENQLSKTTLFINVCANPEWSKNGNWKDIFFFVNKDVIDSHLEFSKLSGCENFLPAGTNVSNAMVILATQSDNDGRKNYFGYDKIALIGYDYSWRHGGKYYAFDEDGNGKAKYMRHAYAYTHGGEFAYTSGNLSFSKDWLHKYITTFNLPVVQCSKHSILQFGKVGVLKEQMAYRHKPADGPTVRKMVKELRELKKREAEIFNTISTIGQDHYWAHARTV
jgi:hypothetical protein